MKNASHLHSACSSHQSVSNFADDPLIADEEAVVASPQANFLTYVAIDVLLQIPGLNVDDGAPPKLSAYIFVITTHHQQSQLVPKPRERWKQSARIFALIERIDHNERLPEGGQGLYNQ